MSPLSHIFLAGVGSGFVNSFVSCPFELAKINMQNQGVPSTCPWSNRVRRRPGRVLTRRNAVRRGSAPGSGQQQGTVYRGPVDFLRQRFRANGIAGCYRGLGATILRETPSYGIYFASYEVRVPGRGGAPFSVPFRQPVATTQPPSGFVTAQGLCRWLTPPGTSTSDLSSMRLLLAGGIGGIMGWIWIYPVDVIKTKMQDAGRAGTGTRRVPPGPTPSCRELTAQLPERRSVAAAASALPEHVGLCRAELPGGGRVGVHARPERDTPARLPDQRRDADGVHAGDANVPSARGAQPRARNDHADARRHLVGERVTLLRCTLTVCFCASHP